MQQPSDLLCNWTATSSPDMSEIDDNDNDAGFGGPIARLRPNGFAGDEFDGIPDDLKNIEAFGRDSFGGMGNINGEQSGHGNNGAPFRAGSSQLESNFRAHIKIEPQPLAADPTGTRMGQDFGFQEAEDASMHIHHDLMFRRIIQDIFTTCSSLCLPTDPSQWTIDHCNSWLNEMCQQFHLPTPGRLNLTGKNLMEMNVEHLVRLIPNGGDQIHAQFQVWKIAFDSYQSQSQPLPCPPSVRSQHLQLRSNLMSSSSSSSDSVLGWGSSSASESPSAPATAQDFLTGFNPDSNHPYYNERYNEFSMVKSQYYESNPMPSGHVEQEIFSPCQSVSSSSSITDDENMQDPQQFDQHDMQGQLQMPPPQMMVCQQQCSQPFYPQYVHQQNSHFQQQKPSYVHQQQMPIPVQPEFHCRPTISQINNGGRTVHLWHFIKELLENPKEYSGCVRWVDREDGTFKIESSLQLARYWGIRKNRSQMNYDKLSRSLRQYYKKGIIQKPEKKQRLVYKFLPPYNHWRPQVN